MNKVILIEDRAVRLEKYLGNNLNKLYKYQFLKTVIGGKDFEKIKIDLIENRFYSLNEFNVIMLHRSGFETNLRNRLLENFKSVNKKLVFFSGGISYTEFPNSNYDFLVMNVSDFYSENLFYFLDNDATNLLHLAYGEKWEFSLLAGVLDRLNFYKINFKEKPYSVVENDLSLNDWIKNKYFEKFINEPNKRVTSNDLNSILEKFKNDLKKLI